MVVGTHSRQTGSTMGGELDGKEGEVTSHHGDLISDGKRTKVVHTI